MNFHRESKREAYDVVVVGGGVGGLTAGSLLAKAGKSVLLVERHDRPGGYAHGFTRRTYRFDSGVHLVSGCGPGGYRDGQAIHRILCALGVEDRVEFIPVDPYTHAVYPGLTLSMPQGEAPFVEALSRAFPGETGIGPFLRTCARLAEESSIANDVMATDSPGVVRDRLATLFRYRRATLAGVLGQFVADPRLKGLLATLWPYLGLPPSKVSFLYWATMFAGYTLDGAYYCRGTFQTFADALAQGLEACGGEILYKAGVRRIEVQDHVVRGVMLDNGQRIRAPVVVSNVDPFQTEHLLPGTAPFPDAYRQTVARGSVSLSAFVVYIATDLDLAGMGAGHESFFYADYDHEENYRRTRLGEITWFSATIPTLVDATLAPPGEHVMLLTTLMPFDAAESWRTGKNRYLEAMLALAERRFPGLRDHLLLVEAGTPRTLERYTLNHRGAAYGWDVTPDQVGPNRLPNRAPLPGLFLAGHWSSPGGGVYGAAVSGLQAAQAVIGARRSTDLLLR